MTQLLIACFPRDARDELIKAFGLDGPDADVALGRFLAGATDIDALRWQYFQWACEAHAQDPGADYYALMARMHGCFDLAEGLAPDPSAIAPGARASMVVADEAVRLVAA